MTDSLERGEEFLAHHGVLGMKWGRRKVEESRADREDRRRAKTPERKAEVKKAYAKRTAGIQQAQKVELSDKTKRLAKSRSIATIAAVGGLATSLLVKDPRVATGAAALAALSGITSLALTNATGRSLNNDVVDQFKDRD
jgi:hypothetical protein